jgi:hypothetical protein
MDASAVSLMRDNKHPDRGFLSETGGARCWTCCTVEGTSHSHLTTQEERHEK